MEKTRVLHVISDTNIGGAGKYLITYCRNRNKEKFDISVALPKNSKLIPELKETGVNLIELDGLKDNSKDLKAYFAIMDVINEIEPDILHTHASVVARFAGKFAKCKPKIVYTKHCDFEPSSIYDNGIVQKLFGSFTKHFADRIIATSEHSRINLIKQGIDDSIIVTIPNGTDGFNRLSQSQIDKIKNKYGIKDEKVVGYVARLVELKGHKTLIDSVKLLKQKSVNIKCVIAGDGDYKEELQEFVKSRELENDVIFTGFVSDVEEILNIFDVQVNCSYLSETTNLALLEGMSIGIPTVATNIGGTPDMITDGKNGYVVPIKDSQQMADKIYEIITNYNLYSDLKMNSVNIFKEKYTSDKFARSIEEVYENLINA